MSRRKFTQEFKEDASKLVVERGQKISVTARDLGIGEPLLGRWVRDYREGKPSRHSGGEGRRLRELEAENRRLRTERDILKKAMAYFAEAPK